MKNKEKDLDFNDLDYSSTKEGQILMAALCRLTVPKNRDTEVPKVLNQVLKELDHESKKIYGDGYIRL